MILAGAWFRSNPLTRGDSTYSFASALFVFLTGGLTAYGLASNNPLFGLFERLTKALALEKCE